MAKKNDTKKRDRDCTNTCLTLDRGIKRKLSILASHHGVSESSIVEDCLRDRLKSVKISIQDAATLQREAVDGSIDREDEPIAESMLSRL